jgi:hypothetical protein
MENMRSSSGLIRNFIQNLLIKREFAKIRKPSTVLSFLYDVEEIYRFRAAEALGYLCKGDVARNFILRLFWHLNDESGAYCIGAPLGIAEIGRANPEVFESFKNKFVSLLDDWEVERKYVAYGIGRTAHIVKSAYPDPVEKLSEKIEEINSPEFTVYAVYALRKLYFSGVKRAEKLMNEIIARFSMDEREIYFYDENQITKRSLCDFLREFSKEKE